MKNPKGFTLAQIAVTLFLVTVISLAYFVFENKNMRELAGGSKNKETKQNLSSKFCPTKNTEDEKPDPRLKIIAEKYEQTLNMYPGTLNDPQNMLIIDKEVYMVGYNSQPKNYGAIPNRPEYFIARTNLDEALNPKTMAYIAVEVANQEGTLSFLKNDDSTIFYVTNPYAADDAGGHLHAFDLKTHKDKFTFEIKSYFDISPEFIDNKIYVYDRFFGIYTLDKNNGKILWSYKMPSTGPLGYLRARPILNNDLAYFGTAQGFIIALDKTTGAEKKKFETNYKGFGGVSSLNAAGETLCFYGGMDGVGPAVLNTNTGEIQYPQIFADQTKAVSQYANMEIKNLQKYENKKYGFELKYPPEVKIEKQNGDFISFLTNQTFDVDKGILAKAGIFISAETIDYNDVIKKLFRGVTSKKADEQIGKYIWTKILSGGMVESIDYFLYKNGILINFGMPAAGEKVELIMKQMISTFKFSND
ncbi:MAG: hypothetical protein UW81_C0009G0003 [Candidatus Giovannonibacteria bacterium GW2011_GWC2_44_9]|uniref:Pyrrolo-quinoline quinone repeat domain-containing protein n=3 Tax=Candidatus Giovannoniibacteriota TaxID=1752738 RepID=A0A0G1L5Z9_9BACT|nr:MAG: hypothetical protein UW49_C0007G0013 [Candidatus Giovannonibacteria bacterium GW2011_GWB1_44_23]KKT64017.1 MAG: hypothetical protein UW57_C0003G0011 [Candidatus Giovannonibacteria bacterium GW2011_GWA1_44_29]KKT83883.1 MAG: hypothetical protein UW81_C0009G0003 [Candidatus Giovannonibacteria bacterium GW2011_GWC2_44_9]KKT91865.1 MAG: hypothetical protein UW93_C0002G0012 [Parcubacteria group bacterium GW2011_GWC1_45_13]